MAGCFVRALVVACLVCVSASARISKRSASISVQTQVGQTSDADSSAPGVSSTSSYWVKRSAICYHADQGNEGRYVDSGTAKECMARCDQNQECKGISFHTTNWCFYFVTAPCGAGQSQLDLTCADEWCNYDKIQTPSLRMGNVNSRDKYQEIGDPVLKFAKELWGSSYFTYMIQGPEAIYYVGVDNDAACAANDKHFCGVQYVGQIPFAGARSGLSPFQYPIPKSPYSYDARGKGLGQNPPQIVRTPDGHIHIFADYDREQMATGMRYLHSKYPDNIEFLDENIDLLPKCNGRKAWDGGYHCRWGVGVSQDIGVEGASQYKVALHILGGNFNPCGFKKNEPVLFIGDGSKGKPFDFSKNAPIRYTRDGDNPDNPNKKTNTDKSTPRDYYPTLFYPLIAWTDKGIVITAGNYFEYDLLQGGGSIHDRDADISLQKGVRHGILVHLNKDGKFVHFDDSTMTNSLRTNFAGMAYWWRPNDLRPRDPSDWRKLVLTVRTENSQRFFEYDANAMLLTATNTLTPPNCVNEGRFLPISETQSAFIYNPCGTALTAYEIDGGGDILQSSSHKRRKKDHSSETKGCRSISLPNPLTGSVSFKKQVWVAQECIGDAEEPFKFKHQQVQVLMKLEFSNYDNFGAAVDGGERLQK